MQKSGTLSLSRKEVLEPVPGKPLLSIIIPARNEGPTIASVLRSLARQDRISDCEVIVVDGMSADNTVEVAESFPFVRVVRAQRGRARQMNEGARAATAPALWFLHADSTFPERAVVDALLAALRDPAVVGGAFRFQLRGNDLYYRFVTVMVNFRARFLRRPYGDQGVFVRADVFREMGGFRELENCEDLDFVIRLRGTGEFRLLPQVVETSARTWQANGKIHTTLWHLVVLARYEWHRRTGKMTALEAPPLRPEISAPPPDAQSPAAPAAPQGQTTPAS